MESRKQKTESRNQKAETRKQCHFHQEEK